MVRMRWMFWVSFALLLNAVRHTSANANSSLPNDNMLTDVGVSTFEHQRKRDISVGHAGQFFPKQRYELNLRSSGKRSVTGEAATNRTKDVTQNKSAIIPKTQPTTSSTALNNSTSDRLTKPAIRIQQERRARRSCSCRNQCSKRTTLLSRREKCFCDQACSKIFMDCCSDYAEACGKVDATDVNDDVIVHKLEWRCVHVTSTRPGRPAFWMIARCPSNWPIDSTKIRCEWPPSNLEVDSFTSFVPVVGSSNKLTYRNQYCAKCNNVSTFEFWNLNFDDSVKLPPLNTPENLRKFLSENLQMFEGVSRSMDQHLRPCYYPDVISTCAVGSRDVRSACVNGTVGLVEGHVSNEKQVFKNEDCALCNGINETRGLRCVTGSPGVPGTSLNRAISLGHYGVSVETGSCLRDEVYDPFSGKCRPRYEWSKSDELEGTKDKHQVILSVLCEETSDCDSLQSLQRDGTLKTAIASYFEMNGSQIVVNDYRDLNLKTRNFRITFTLHLTPSQSLIMASDPQLLKTSNETIGLRRLFKFHEPFKLIIARNSFVIYRLQVRQMACIQPHVYRFGEYTTLDDRRIRVNSTGAVYEQTEYLMNTTNRNPNVTVCLKMIPILCNDTYKLIKLDKSEYTITSNLELIFRSKKYNFGDYYHDNGTTLICVEYKRKYTVSTVRKVKDDLALTILTWIGFIVSIICLLALVVTYSIFQELRTLPGKNLINLSLSLCLAEILWLCGSSAKDSHDACTVIAIANHYFFLVFFVASSVIAFHSCSVFGKKISFRRSKAEEKNTFLFYSLVAWGFPALFVLVSALLDHWKIFVVDYGEDICWLGTRQSKIFLFIIPFGTMLLFNLFLFVFIAVSLQRNQKSTAGVLERATKKQQKQNITISVKLSTLMGFSWFFGLLQVALENKTDVFSYLFVIFVSFQGLFICMAFLFKRKTARLYSRIISTRFTSSSSRLETRLTKLETLSNLRETCV